ncbi:hypothetical protein U9M48_040997 [Paspalum notatum var. saurae]|uniref:Uncharacterized protein n=1 Tax=Paspalum notatum var. saurae TaxID=547442 RepID=A0AAQ3XDR9_PASNO
MENLGEEDNSSTANQSFSDDGYGGAAASEESGWTSYIDYFMETQHGQEVEASSAADPSIDDVGRRCRSTSEYSGDCGAAGGSMQLPALVEPLVVSRRLRLKEGWMRKKKVLYDESLEDTATSPISSPKLIELRDSDATQQKKENSCDVIWHSKKSTTGDVNGVNTATGTEIKEEDGDAYDNNELRKKGLCLVPVSAFHV